MGVGVGGCQTLLSRLKVCQGHTKLSPMDHDPLDFRSKIVVIPKKKVMVRNLKDWTKFRV